LSAALRAFDGRLPKRAHNYRVMAELSAVVTKRGEASGNGRFAPQNRSCLLRRAVESAVCGPVQRPCGSMAFVASAEVMRAREKPGTHGQLCRSVGPAVSLSYASEALQWGE
jgi:hypothetical protein